MTNNLLTIIEQDDLVNFQRYFSLDNWRQSITSIANYAGPNSHSQNSYVDCDCFKYSVHCQSDKIFHYLVSLVDAHQYGDNYGWPLLSMTIKNQRYDYAQQIIDQKTFNYYANVHTKCFLYIENQPDTKKHIDFLFHYLTKFNFYDFDDRHLIYNFTHLVCFNEDTFNRFNTLYQKISHCDNSILDIYHDNFDILADEILSRKFNPFILEKLSSDQFTKMLLSVMDDSIIFTSLFESSYAQQALNYLLQYPNIFQSYIDKHPVVIHNLSLSCLVLLIDNNINLWHMNEEDIIPLDYVLDNCQLNEERTLYFLSHYTQQIYDILEKRNNKNNLYDYCYKKLLQETLHNKLPSKNIFNSINKI